MNQLLRAHTVKTKTIAGYILLYEVQEYNRIYARFQFWC